MELLRFTTAGSVDDGKSTLIGRLLYDSKAIFEDQMEAIEQASINRGEEHVNLALLTDGLRAEREQGITIDVAYRFFSTTRRKFIVADTPGHEQYTRNMATGASTAEAAVLLIDARLAAKKARATMMDVFVSFNFPTFYGFTTRANELNAETWQITIGFNVYSPILFKGSAL